MSHWHRAARSISVGTMLRRAKLRFILDDGLPVQLPCLPEGAHTLRSLGFAQRPSREDLVALCQKKHGMLVTADPEIAQLLGLDSKAPWGVLLLSNIESDQIELLRRFFTGKLSVRPSVERMTMVEYAARHRVLVDLRHRQPVLGIFCSCRWIPEQ